MVTEQTSNDLFNKIRSKFGNIQIGNSNGEATANPNEAVFFDFEFKEDADTFGRVSISLADGETVKVFYNRELVEKIDEDSKSDWYSFLKELKDFSVEHSLGFDVRDITKSNLTKQDFKNLADTTQTLNTAEMSEELSRIVKLSGLEKEPVAEGLTGTSKSSFENLDKTRLIIRHKGKVDETVPGARSRQIQSLYIENEDGERFKYPLVHLAGARAMARHVANGGRPHDEFGQHIVSTSEDIAKLNSFARYVSNKDQLNDSAGEIIDQTKLKLENLRSYVKNIAKQSHYETASKDFKLNDDAALDDNTANSYREKFTLKNLDSRVEEALPLIHRVMSEMPTQDTVNEFDGEKALTAKDIEIPSPVDGGAFVQSFLANPDKKLILNKDKGELSSKEMQFTKDQQGKNQMFSTILSDIAERLLVKEPKDDVVANFASDIADQIGKEGTPFFKPNKDYIKNKKIAYQLARRYADDVKKMKQEPGYADEIRISPSEFSPKKDRLGKAKQSETAQFENWANRVEAKVTEGTWSLPSQDASGVNFDSLKDAMSKEMSVGTDAINATSVLSDLGFGDDELYDNLGDLAEQNGPDVDARTIVHDYVINKILKSSKVNNYYTPEEQENLKNAVHSNANTFMKSDANEYAKAPRDEEDRKEKLKTLQDLQANPKLNDPESVEAIQKRKQELGMQKEAESDYLYLNGKEIDQGSIMYKMEDYSDGIFELQSAKYADGTELDEKELEELESTQELIDWVRIDFVSEDAVSEDNQLEGLTFEDIKPYVSMYTDKDGKKVNAVLDKDGEEVFKTHDAKAAMAYLSQNYNKLKEQDSEVQDEGNAYSGAVAKAKMNGMKKGDKVKGPDGDEITLEEVPAEAQEEADEINTELDRIKHLANIQ